MYEYHGVRVIQINSEFPAEHMESAYLSFYPTPDLQSPEVPKVLLRRLENLSRGQPHTLVVSEHGWLQSDADVHPMRECPYLVD